MAILWSRVTFWIMHTFWLEWSGSSHLYQEVEETGGCMSKFLHCWIFRASFSDQLLLLLKKNCIHEDNDKLELKLMSSVTGFVFPPCFRSTFFSFCISKHISLTFPFCKETVLKSGGGNAAPQSNYRVIESFKLEKMFKIVSLTINLTCWVP